MMEESGRPLTAKEKRQEQLKRWINSATDVESPVIQNFKPKVKFNDGAVFLAACSSGDLEEVQVLIDKGADINFANIDGLTALHQACIDGNVEVVEFLVERGVEIDQEDNEGWTPLHAAASCGFMDIAKYLVENGANVAAVNSEGEVPLDIAEEDDMIDFLQKEIDKQGLDIERARNEEREQMTVDATQQLNAVRNGEKPSIYRHPKSGATSLHVAAAKGYINVLKILLQAGMDVNVRDNDGWTPLHAASHWSQKEAAKLLADKYADFNARSKLGQTACDVADEDMLEYLEDLKEDQEKNRLESKEGDLIEPPSPTIQHTSIQSITRETKYIEKSSSGDRYTASTEKEMNVRNSSIGNNINHQEEDSCSSDEDANSSSSSEVAPSKTIEKMQKDTDKKFDEAFNQNSSFKVGRTGSSNNVSLRNVESETTQLRQSSSGSNVSSSTGFAGRRTTRPASLHISSNQVKDTRPPIMSAVELSSNRPMAAAQPIQASKSNGPTPGTPTERNSGIKEGAPKTWRSGLRKTGSFDDKMRPLQRGTLGSSSRASDNERSLLSKSSEETTNSSGGIQTARVAPILDARISDKSKRSNDEDTSTHFSFQKSGSFHRYGADSYRGSSTAPITFRRSSDSSTSKADNTTSTSPAATSSSTAAPSASFAIGESRLDRRRSHLQPVRDEEAEAQRKARSRRERQSRRSTQGVTLDVYEEAKRHIDHMKQERENNASNIAASRKVDSSDGANQDGAHIPHNDSNSLLHRRIGVTTPTSTVGNRGGTVTLPSSYIPSNERVGNTAKTGPINSSANVPSINIVDSGNDVNKQNTEEGNNTDEDKNSLLTANQSSNAKKTTAQQRRRQRKERRSTGLPGLRVTDTGADVDANSGRPEQEEDHLLQDRGDLEWLRSLARVTKKRQNYRVSDSIGNQGSGDNRSRGSGRKRVSLSSVETRFKRKSYLIDLHPNEIKRRQSLTGCLSASPFQFIDNNEDDVDVTHSEKTERTSKVLLDSKSSSSQIKEDHGTSPELQPNLCYKYPSVESETTETTHRRKAHCTPSAMVAAFSKTGFEQDQVCSGGSIQTNSETRVLLDSESSRDLPSVCSPPKGLVEFIECGDKSAEMSFLSSPPCLSDVNKVKRKLNFEKVLQVGSDDDGKSENDNFESTKAERLRATASRYDSSSTDRYNRQRGGAKTSDSDGSRYGIDRSEDKDYKKLYDEQLEENKRLKNELADARKEIADLQERLNRAEDSVVQRKAVEAEKREKRALERKLAEVEKELMAHNELKTDNQRLKDENGALIRVISKLSK